MDLPSSSSLRIDVSSNRFLGEPSTPGWNATHPPSATLVVRLRCWVWKLLTEKKQTHHLCSWNLGHNNYNKTWKTHKTPIPLKKNVEWGVQRLRCPFHGLYNPTIPFPYGFLKTFSLANKNAGQDPSLPIQPARKNAGPKRRQSPLSHRIHHGPGIFTYMEWLTF